MCRLVVWGPDLDAVIFCVGYVGVACGIDGDPPGPVELPIV